MIKDNSTKIFSISGFTHITKIHDGNFAAFTMNGILKIFSGIKPFKCLKEKKISKNNEIFSLKEINNNPSKINLILYEKNIYIYSLDNKYQKCFLVMNVPNNNYIGALIQLKNKNIIYWDKDRKIKFINYLNQNKILFDVKINEPKIIINNKPIKNNSNFIISFLEYKENHIITTSTNKHPLGENIIKFYKIDLQNNKIKLINFKSFEGFSCAIFENNICKLDYQNTICVALGQYIRYNNVYNNGGILLIDWEYMQISTIIELKDCVNCLFNFSLSDNLKREYEYLIINQCKISNKKEENIRFLNFYIFEPKYKYEPLLIDNKKVETKSTLDVIDCFLLESNENNKNLLIFQTDQISIYSINFK